MSRVAVIDLGSHSIKVRVSDLSANTNGFRKKQQLQSYKRQVGWEVSWMIWDQSREWSCD
jgi:exopolyphosphatase/pppGpp-phosphohydrolase